MEFKCLITKKLNFTFVLPGVGDESLQPMMANQFESGNEDEDEEDVGVVVNNPNPAELNEGAGNHQVEAAREEHHPEGPEANQYQVYFYDSKEMVSFLSYHCFPIKFYLFISINQISKMEDCELMDCFPGFYARTQCCRVIWLVSR